MWSSIEQSLGIICACAPSLKAIFRNFFQEKLSTWSSHLTSRGSGRSGNRGMKLRKTTRNIDGSFDSAKKINVTSQEGIGFADSALLNDPNALLAKLKIEADANR